MQFLPAENSFRCSIVWKKIQSYITQRYKWGASTSSHGHLFPCLSALQGAFSCYSWARLPQALEHIVSLLVLYIRRASSVQEGLHNLSVSLHTVWGDRDKPLETKELFPGCKSGPLVAWSKPMLCPLLPSQELQASSTGGGLEEMGSKRAGKIWSGQIWNLFPQFSSSAEG